MGDISHPTTADYAYAAAQDNQNTVTALSRRVGQLEDTVNDLIGLVAELGGPLLPSLPSPKLLAIQREEIARVNAEARTADDRRRKYGNDYAWERNTDG
jgi:hypothetical protein